MTIVLNEGMMRKRGKGARDSYRSLYTVDSADRENFSFGGVKKTVPVFDLEERSDAKDAE